MCHLDKCLFIPDREPTTDRTRSQIQLGQPLSFTRVIYRNVSVSQMRRNNSKTFALLKPTPCHSMNAKNQAHCSNCWQLNRLEGVFYQWLSLSKFLLCSSAGQFLPGCLVVLCFFTSIPTKIVPCSSAGLSNSQRCLLFIQYWGGRALVSLASFRDFLKLLWVVYFLY